MQVYINLAYVGTPISAPVLVVDAIYPELSKLVSDDEIDYFVHTAAKLYDANGLLIADTALDVVSPLAKDGFLTLADGNVLMDVVVVDGKIVSARLASTNVVVKGTDKLVVGTISVGTTSGN